MEKMKAFPHAVIYNGTFYPANTPMKAAEEGKEERPMEEAAEGKPKKRGVK